MKQSAFDESEIFAQVIDEEELAVVWGGQNGAIRNCSLNNTAEGECLYNNKRSIYGGCGFPNCALTVEDGSWCSDNDACYIDAVSYTGMNDCSKAWE